MEVSLYDVGHARPPVLARSALLSAAVQTGYAKGIYPISTTGERIPIG